MLLDKIQLEADEEIIKQTRRHWFILFSEVFAIFMVAVLPLIIIAILPLFDLPLPIDLSGYGAEITYLYSLFLLFLWIGAFTIWNNYYLDMFILTDRRVIVLNQKGFFRRNVASFRLERLQDMDVEIDGLIATLLDYGTLQVETAGHRDDDEFKVTGIPNPRDIKTMVMRASDERLREMKPVTAPDNL